MVHTITTHCLWCFLEERVSTPPPYMLGIHFFAPSQVITKHPNSLRVGTRVWDVDGNKYFDFLSGKRFGCLLCVTRMIAISRESSLPCIC
jgi:hypothetical protein